MWNFVGRQNEIHSSVPGDMFRGNWESGIRFIDELRLGDQSDAPRYLKDNKGKNHYFFLPLLLGLIGLCFQFGRDKRGCWLNFLMFFMTGIAIVIYLNQPPFQVRERDYAYAGSFYFFCVWIGLALQGIIDLLQPAIGKCPEKVKAAVCVAASVLCLGVPALMTQQNWDDHDRSNRNTAVEVATNYLNSVGKNGILVTHGDNDTFPVWYAQEVEGIRTDVRICNTSLLGTDWHIDQMKYACNESAPLPISVPMKQYLYGTNEFVYIYDTRDTVIPISDVMRVFKHPDAKLQLTSGMKADYIVSRRISVPVNKENVLKYGILDQKYASQIPDEIILTISKDKTIITKQELFILDLLAGYKWDRPLHFLGMGGDINIGIKEYLMFEGFSYKFVPIKTGCKRADPGITNPDELYSLMTDTYVWDNVSRDDFFVDYQNIYTFCGVVGYRDLFASVAREMNRHGRPDDAVALLDKCQEVMKDSRYPLDMCLLHLGNEMAVVNMVEQYYRAGAVEKARDLAGRFCDELLISMKFFMEFYTYAKSDFETAATCIYYICDDVMAQYNDTEAADAIMAKVDEIFGEV